MEYTQFGSNSPTRRKVEALKIGEAESLGRIK